MQANSGIKGAGSVIEPVRMTISRAVVRVTGTSGHTDSQIDRASAESGGSGGVSSRPWRMVTVIPQRPLEKRFRAQKLTEGLRSLLGACFGLGAGLFLLTHIPGTPSLRLQVIFVAAVCLVLGGILVPFAAGYLFGRLRLDSFGISMSPWPIGFRISWHDLSRWSIEGLQLHLVSRRSSKEEIVPLHVLESGDRLLVRDILRSCAGEREGRISAADGPRSGSGSR